jgi:hypothetical protein
MTCLYDMDGIATIYFSSISPVNTMLDMEVPSGGSRTSDPQFLPIGGATNVRSATVTLWSDGWE